MVKEDKEKSKRQLIPDVKETQSLTLKDSDQNFFFFYQQPFHVPPSFNFSFPSLFLLFISFVLECLGAIWEIGTPLKDYFSAELHVQFCMC